MFYTHVGRHKLVKREFVPCRKPFGRFSVRTFGPHLSTRRSFCVTVGGSVPGIWSPCRASPAGRQRVSSMCQRIRSYTIVRKQGKIVRLKYTVENIAPRPHNQFGERTIAALRYIKSIDLALQLAAHSRSASYTQPRCIEIRVKSHNQA